MFGSTDTVFIACPTPDAIESELATVKEVVSDLALEPYVAVERYLPSRDIHCEKVCTKIIESKFCIAILSPPDDTANPNPNVYFEFGLMSGLAKKIIPILPVEASLPFNVQSLDTVRYSSGDLTKKVRAAVEATLAAVREDEIRTQGVGVPLRSLTLYLELSGHRQGVASQVTSGTHFKVFGEWKFAAVVRGASDIPELLRRVNLLSARIENEAQKRQKRIEAMEFEIARESKNAPKTAQSLTAKRRVLQTALESLRRDGELFLVCPESAAVHQVIVEGIAALGDLAMPVRVLRHSELDSLVQELSTRRSSE